MNSNLPDIFASVVHDIKNRLFNIEMRLNEIPLDKDGLSKNILDSALRLDQMLTAYRLLRHESHADLLTLTNVNVRDLLEDALCQIEPLESRLKLQLDVSVEEDWICSRDIVHDIIVNGLQNAARFATSIICVSVTTEAEWMTIRIEDDGPGFVFPEEGNPHSVFGVGLFVADKIMRMHQRHQHHGKLTLGASRMGGARIDLVFP